MARQDLISITFEDLVTFTNRGTVNRAQKELDSGLACELSEQGDGTLAAKWSDGAECVVPGAKTLREGRCSCPSVGMCRHLVRTVLLYQRQAATAGGNARATGNQSPPEPWDPGEFTDEMLRQHIPKPVYERARQQFEQGILAEVVRAPKPTALLHGLSVNIRFLVRGDLRYTHVDCAPQLAQQMTALAVWAFRCLPAGQRAGIVVSGSAEFPVPAALLENIEKHAAELLEHGFSAAPPHFASTLSRLAEACQKEGLIWPGDNIDGLADQYQRYSSHDALFAPETAVELLGELLLRCDVIATGGDTTTGGDGRATMVPQPLVRGTCDDRPLDLGAGRYVGLGCGVQVLKKGAILNSFLQDQDSGMVVAVTREFADPVAPSNPAGSAGTGGAGQVGRASPPATFARLAMTPVVQSASLAALGQGTLLLSGGKRTPARRLIVGRTRSTVNPQAFQWEQLKEPVRVDSYDELRARLAALPPAALRPRRVADNFHAFSVARVSDAGFDTARQKVEATLLDAAGSQALLTHPYSGRGREGAEALLHALTETPGAVRFVAGTVRLTAKGLEIHPTAVICDGEGGARVMIQPWVQPFKGKARRGLVVGTFSPDGQTADGGTAADSESSEPDDPVSAMLSDLQSVLGEIMVLGLRRSDAALARRTAELGLAAGARGFTRLSSRIQKLAALLEQKQHATRWDGQPAAVAVQELAALLRLGQELAG